MRMHKHTKKDVTEVVWTIVRKENREIRDSHPKVYRWAKEYLDSLRVPDEVAKVAAPLRARVVQEPEL